MIYRRVVPIAAVLAAGFFGLSKTSSSPRYSGSHLNDNGLKNYTFVDSKKFELINVAVLVRHGARTPNFFVESKFGMPDWESGIGFVNLLPEIDFDIALKELPENNFIKEESVMEGFYESIKERSSRAQLTLIGQEQSIAFGKELRRIYMDGYKIIRNDFNDSEIYCRTTKFPRTFYTMKGILSGIYGINSFDVCHRPIIHTMSIAIDPFNLNSNVCSVMEKFLSAGGAEIAKDPEIMKMKCVLKSMLGVESLKFTSPGRKSSSSSSNEQKRTCNKKKAIEPKVENIEELTSTVATGTVPTGDVPIYAVRDDFYSRLIHEHEVPSSFSKLLPELNRLSSEEVLYESMGGSVEWEDRITLLVSPAFNFIKTNMKKVLESSGGDQPKAGCVPDMKDALTKKKYTMKMQIVSCHDTTLLPLLICLRMYDGHWPHFTSNMIFELYKETKTGDMYTRIVYNGNVQQTIVTETACENQNEYSKLGLVPYTDFLKFVDGYSIPDDKYMSACDKAGKLFASGKPVTRDQLI